MVRPGIDAAVVAAAQLTAAHVAAQGHQGEEITATTRGILTLFGSYLDEVRSGRHQTEPSSG